MESDAQESYLGRSRRGFPAKDELQLVRYLAIRRAQRPRFSITLCSIWSASGSSSVQILGIYAPAQIADFYILLAYAVLLTASGPFIFSWVNWILLFLAAAYYIADIFLVPWRSWRSWSRYLGMHARLPLRLPSSVLSLFI